MLLAPFGCSRPPSVKRRLASSTGISFAEFTYHLLQAADFEALHRTHGCTVQLGGSDQYGNIMAGVDLIRRTNSVADPESSQEAFGLTMPLLTTPDGTKFGKSVGNALWLDRARTSGFELYQVRASRSQQPGLTRAASSRSVRCRGREVASGVDPVVLRRNRTHHVPPNGKLVALLPAYAHCVQSAPGTRYAQTRLAAEVTELVHGGASRAVAARGPDLAQPRPLGTPKPRARSYSVGT